MREESDWNVSLKGWDPVHRQRGWLHTEQRQLIVNVYTGTEAGHR